MKGFLVQRFPMLFGGKPLRPEDRASFEAHTRELSTVYVRVLVMGLAAGFLAFWPFDGWFTFSVGPDGVGAMADFRMAVLSCLVLIGLGVFFVPAVIGRPQWVLMAVGAALIGCAASFLGPLFNLDSGVIDLALILPYGLVLLFVSPVPRLLFTLAILGAWLTVLLTFASPSFERAMVHFVILLAMALLAVAAGHMIWNAARESFRLTRDLARVGDDLEQKVSARLVELRETYDLITQQREAERARLGRELHDATGQTLTGLRLELALARLAPEASDATALGLSDLGKPLDALFESLRDVMMRLRPTVLDDLGLPAALEWLVFQHRRQHAAPLSASISESIASLHPATAIGVFRVAETALAYLVEHPATDIALALRQEGLELIVEVRGKSARAATSDAASAASRTAFLREQARAMGAVLEVGEGGIPGVINVSLRVPTSAAQVLRD